jgi:hypothetical protein
MTAVQSAPDCISSKSALGIESDNLVEFTQVDEKRVGGELLPAHRVTSTGNRDRQFSIGGESDGAAEVVDVVGLEDLNNAGGVETRVHVVHDDGRRWSLHRRRNVSRGGNKR